MHQISINLEAQMGGIGSGRHTDRPTTDECVRITLADLKQLGMLKRHCMNRRNRAWSFNGNTVAELTLIVDIDCHEPHPCLKITGHSSGRRINCLVWLDSSPMRFGGERWYALCPKTGKRCTTLVLPAGKTHFASVSGWCVSYGSQRECKVYRAHRAIDKAASRLLALSKYARKPTREGLLKKLTAKHEIVDRELDRLECLLRAYG